MLYSETLAEHLSLTPLSAVKVWSAKTLPKPFPQDHNRQGSLVCFQENAAGTVALGRCIVAFLLTLTD